MKRNKIQFKAYKKGKPVIVEFKVKRPEPLKNKKSLSTYGGGEHYIFYPEDIKSAVLWLKSELGCTCDNTIPGCGLKKIIYEAFEDVME